MLRIRFCFIAVLLFLTQVLWSQPGTGYNWTADGNGYYYADSNGAIIRKNLATLQETPIVTPEQLLPSDSNRPILPEQFYFSDDRQKILIFTNTQRVWRYHTRGDYWVLDLQAKTLHQLGKNLPEASLMFAKLSPDGKKAAYSSNHNLYVEDLETEKITPLTTDGTDRLINGTFDWVYEEEFGCRDGFRWSPDSRSIAYWQVDARKIRNFLMINNTDSIYPFTIPVEYPVTGEAPSPTRIGVVDVISGKTTWMDIPGDPSQNYLPRMEWASNEEIVLQQLNRHQNKSSLYYADIHTGTARLFYTETDKAWIDIKSRWHGDDPRGWDWLSDNKSFLWVTEKDGWRHIYNVPRNGQKETLVTRGDYDIIDIKAVDEKSGYVYFTASPENATQQYLYRCRLNGKGNAEKISPASEQGTHEYEVSPNGHYAEHRFSNANSFPYTEWVSLPTHKTIIAATNKRQLPPNVPKVEFLKIKTDDNVTMDAWMVKPLPFDSTKKYPVVFYVYTEPAATTVNDSWGNGRNFLYQGNMSADGYIYVSIDGRGTPSLKGAAWRKSIFKNVGIINIQDQAAAARKILELPYVDTSRVAVWGWSGGGSTTLNLLFQHPEIYKTGISIAPVANQLTYDNIYEERYMGLPQEDMSPYITGSPISHAQGLQGKLLLIQGTGDDNVHYQNSEMLINQLIKYNKLFQFMAYPNRTHAIREGEGTSRHLGNVYTHFLRENCPPGGR